YSDTVRLKLPVAIAHGTGLNTFNVIVDPTPLPNEIPEYEDNLNNQVTTTLNIQSSDIVPVYPYKYDILAYGTVTLKASTVNPFAAAADYVFQMDTSHSFNSPLLQSAVINHSGGVVSWLPSSFQ